MAKTLNEWLSEMERLDKEAKDGLLFEAHERDISMCWLIDEQTRGLCFKALTELPRAVEIIKAIMESYTGHNKEHILGVIEKILNGVEK
ncbi:hypothetical protein FBR05_00300 [Deltaproteobacteria bacterium PRO3]|nr:hypothetical protein [Deltaproteobacteria bacterium PRO3]